MYIISVPNQHWKWSVWLGLTYDDVLLLQDDMLKLNQRLNNTTLKYVQEQLIKVVYGFLVSHFDHSVTGIKRCQLQ